MKRQLMEIGKALLIGFIPIAVIIGAMFFFFLVMPNLPREYEFMHSAEEIVKMEIAYADKTLRGYSNDTSDPNFVDQFSIVKTLEEAQWETILEDLEENAECYKWTNDPNPSLHGNILWITYEDGCQELLSRGGTYQMGSSPEERTDFTWYHFDEAFHEILGTYID